jgi:hypothetical protein
MKKNKVVRKITLHYSSNNKTKERNNKLKSIRKIKKNTIRKRKISKKHTKKHTKKYRKSYKLNNGNRQHGGNGGNRDINKNVKHKKYSFKKLNCSPKIGAGQIEGNKNNRLSNKIEDYTCYSNASLLYLKKYWNQRHPDLMINTNNSKKIWSLLRFYMKDVCDRESCWLKQNFIKNNLNRDLSLLTFAPESPSTWKKNKNQWLTSLDIDKVMKQYEEMYKCFEFIGPSPIDFDSHQKYSECVWEELCKFDLKDYIDRGKTKIGIIFNTDPHYKEGSHWISLFINIKDKYIFYFDSNGDKIPNEIEKLINRINSQGIQLGFHFNIMDNRNVEHQRSNTECGMYSLYFIVQLLTENKSPQYFFKERIRDEEMEKLRNKYFNPEL